MSARAVANEVDYCIYCHEQSGDFCSKGFPVKKSDPSQGLRTHPLGELMTGCPLEEKISEMHVLKRDGYLLAPLAVVMVDNPMCPMTGHRICNDCMKACVYQKQTPVNIPEIETRVLTDVLGLPWGVEIYDLLTRWNPLRADQWVVQPYQGKKVLVAGMGPAGLTLAHHLLQAGCAVVGVDGLKIEPLDEALLKQPIYAYQDLVESLDDRLVLGFGGVAEYGITVRWDKNFLKLVYLNLLRRPYFQIFGGMRFGGTITVEDAWEMGFDHLAIAVGAGLPKALPIPGSLAPGMRQANDFLMALQLTGAGKASSLANLQVRLPALVIGGGLTGIDTATEVQAYYIQQVEKIVYRYGQLAQRLSESTVRGVFHQDAGELEILDEWLAHGRAVKAERERALRAGGKPSFHALLSLWGGVRVVYRRSLQESPAYRLNHEEVKAAFEEGIGYIERVEPIAAEVDHYGHVSHLVCQRREQDKVGRWISTDQTCRLPVRAIFVATGAMPNVAYGFEHAGTLKRQGFQYLTYQMNDQGELMAVKSQQHIKQPDIGMFTSYQKADYRVSLLGDTHQVFHGSVVKAVASAKHAYPQIMAQLKPQVCSAALDDYPQFQSHIAHLLHASVVNVTRLLPQVVKITVSAPMAAQQHAPGQFYRLQHFETDAITKQRTLLQSEGVALVGIPAGHGQLDFIVDECGASSRLLALLKPGQRIALMGPTGVRTKIPMAPETLLIIGNHRSIAYMMAVAPAMRLAGHRVIILLSLPQASYLHHQAFLGEHSDAIIYVTDTGELVETDEDHASSFSGSWHAALLSQADLIQLAQVNRVLIQGSSTLIRQVQAARKHPELMPYFSQVTDWIASVYGPMQCMLKGVCAQCLQWQIDPETGKRTKAVFACSWQDQPMDIVDFGNLDERLAQNSVQEKLTGLWLTSLLE
jgi:NADPH-dependent glutamate synthase beta subunit-like oxidoreductase/NAD(P)H-flavin reductase